MTIRVRRCAAPLDGDELDIVTELHRQCMPHDALYPVVQAQWWIACDDDEPIGYAGASVRAVDARHSALFLVAAGVLPIWRHLGTQQRMIRARLSWGRSLALPICATYTLRDNVASANALIHCGFRRALGWCYAGRDVDYWERRL